MPVELWCARGVFMTQIRDDVVVLDIDKDQYHCLLDAAHQIRPEDDGRLTVDDEETALELLAAALATITPVEEPRIVPTVPTREIIPPAGGPLLEAFGAGITLAVGTLAFKGRSLRDLTRTGSRRSHPARSCDEATLHRIIASSRRALPWIPFEGECLQRSFQMRRLLQGRGFEADWIFGVRTWPFAAHCWLQRDDLVVGDRLERVLRYTPIMVA
jgi:hypothetical protein